MKRELLQKKNKNNSLLQKKQEQFSDPTANVASFIQRLDYSFGRELILLIDESKSPLQASEGP